MLITEAVKKLSSTYSGEFDISGIKKSFSVYATDKNAEPCPPDSGAAQALWVRAEYEVEGEVYVVCAGVTTDGACTADAELDEAIGSFEEEMAKLENEIRGAADPKAFLKDLISEETKDAENRVKELEGELNRSVAFALGISIAAFFALAAVIIISVI